VWRLRPEPRRSGLVLAAAFALSHIDSFATASTLNVAPPVRRSAFPTRLP
jgi:hypothetical protein